MDTNTYSGHEPGFEGGNEQIQYTGSGEPFSLYDDPAVINPDELATFPKQVKADGYYDHDRHHASHRTPVRDGRNITRTDNHPDKHGFM